MLVSVHFRSQHRQQESLTKSHPTSHAGTVSRCGRCASDGATVPSFLINKMPGEEEEDEMSSQLRQPFICTDGDWEKQRLEYDRFLRREETLTAPLSPEYLQGVERIGAIN